MRQRSQWNEGKINNNNLRTVIDCFVLFSFSCFAPDDGCDCSEGGGATKLNWTFFISCWIWQNLADSVWNSSFVDNHDQSVTLLKYPFWPCGIYIVLWVWNDKSRCNFIRFRSFSKLCFNLLSLLFFYKPWLLLPK